MQWSPFVTYRLDAKTGYALNTGAGSFNQMFISLFYYPVHFPLHILG